MNILRNNIPNTITCLNLLSGCLAVVVAFKCYDQVLWGLTGYQWAYIFIALAAVFDFCDGFAARLLHAVSGIGKELDSLCDLVSFGLAPAMVLYNMMLAHDASPWSLCALLIPIFGALRLAKFNVSTNQTTTFTGLPIPANAIFWIGYTAFYANQPGLLVLTLVCIVILSLLMVCPLRMFSLKMHNLSVRENWAQFLLVVATVAFVICFGLPGLALAMALYVILSFVKREKKA